MARPADWQWAPLGLDIDPVPGDPAQVSLEERHLATVAAQITDQVAALRRIATSDVEVGEHADKIRDSAGELAEKLDAVVGRYNKVSSALRGWIPELEQAQRMSITALDQAEGPHAKLNQQVVLPAGTDLTAQQKQAVTSYHTAMQHAQQELDAARQLLDQATSLRDTEASRYAGLIRSACNDGVKDSWWDSFKGWVDKYAWLIKDICLALEIIATVLALLALIFTGVGLALLIAGAVLTAVALVGRTMLAASGDGSWFDVIVDAVALLTFGLGTEMTEALGTATKGAVGAADGLRSEAADRVFADAAKDAGELASRGYSHFAAEALDAASEQRAAYLADNALPLVDEEAGTSFMERLLGAGDQGIVNNMKTVAGLTAKFGDDSKVASYATKASTLQNLLRANFVVTNVDTITPVVAGGVEFDGPSGQPLVSAHIPVVGDAFDSHFEEPLEMEGGLSTAQVQGFALAGSLL
jgi:hypothetical protein